MNDIYVLKNTTRVLLSIIILFCLFSIPVSADFVGPSHELADNLDTDDITVTPAQDESGNIVTEDATITYNITIDTENARDTFPYIYPMELTIRDDTQIYGTKTIFLSPTKSRDYVPSYGNEDERDEYELREDFQTYIAFNDIQPSDLDASDEIERELEFELTSRMTDETTQVTSTANIKGSTPQGRSTNSFSVSSTVGFDETSELSSVDRYRISSPTSDPGFLEEFSIPDTGRFNGDISNFQNMRQPNTERPAKIEGNENGFNMVSLTRNIYSGSPQTIAITYDILTEDAEIELTPLRGSGDPIDPDTEYKLTEDPTDSQYCRSIGSSENLCVFTLSSEETEEINKLGELYLEYNSNTPDINANIACKSVITGYLSDNAETCGKSSELVDTDDISVSAFEGKNSDESDSEYTEYEFGAEFLGEGADDDNPTAEIDLRASIESNIESSEEVDVTIIEDESINHEEIIDSSGIVGRDTITVNSGEQVAIEEENVNLDSDEAVKVYYAVICEPGYSYNECSTVDNIDISTLLVGMDGESGKPDLNVISPIRIDLDVLDTTETVENRVQTRTTDPNFESQPNRDDEDWTYLPDEDITDFEGQIEESVILRGVSSSNPADNIGTATSKLSDISPEGSWNTDDYESYISVEERTVRYSAQDLSDEGYERASATPERRAQVDTRQARFQIITGSEFSSVVDSERNWYVDRDNPDTVTETVEDSAEILKRHTDPDECLNCLYAENVSEAEERFSKIPGVELIETVGEDNWERVSEEPYEIANVRIESEEIIESNSELGDGYTLIKERPDSPDLWRRVDYETREIYEWKNPTDVQAIEFNSPEYDEVYKWVSETYNIEYEFTGQINDPSTLRTYQRDITTEEVTWEEHTEWFDVSESVDYENNTDLLNLFGLQYQSRPEVNYIHWNDDLHSLKPDSDEFIDTRDSLCDSGTVVTESVPGGAGGEGIIETCEIDGEETVTRFGKTYNNEGVYVEELTLWDENLESDTENIVVNINEGAGAPTFDVENVNEKVDYTIDKIPFTGTIESDTDKLDEKYQLVVSPADVFESSTQCPGTGYTESTQNSIQRQTTTSDVFRQTVECQSNLFEDAELANEKDNFKLYEHNSETDTNTYENIPSGAIQSCADPLVSTDDDNSCEVPETGEEITYKSGGSYQSIDAEKIGQKCPAGYSINSNTEGDITEYSCNLDIEPTIDLKSRQVSVNYQEIQAGVVEKCSDIPTSSETGNHDGYTGTEDDTEIVCNLVDNSDPGPESFVLAEKRGDYINYNAPPAGAVRGIQFKSDTDSLNRCNSFTRTEENILSCEYDIRDSSEEITTNYASITEGEWSNIQQDLDNISNIESGQKIAWQSNFVMDGSENFTTTINPRQANFDIKDNQNVEFEFKLQTSNGETVQRETVDLKLCKSTSTKNLPLGPDELNESAFCTNFDALMTGETDYVEDRNTIDDAIEDVESGVKSEYVVKTVMNDACPYNNKYPRNHEDIEPLVIPADEIDSRSELEEEAERHIIARYNDDVDCAVEDVPSEEEENPPEEDNDYDGGYNGGDEEDSLGGEDTPQRTLEQRFTFGPESFVATTDVQNIRRIDMDYLNLTHDSIPVQSQWNTEFGNSLRLGSPVITPGTAGDDYVNSDLIAMYTFDHNPSEFAPIDTPGNYNAYRITDVDSDSYGLIENSFYNDYTSGTPRDEAITDLQDTDTVSPLYHGQIWYGNSCTSWGEHTYSSAWDYDWGVSDIAWGGMDGWFEGVSCSTDISNMNTAIAIDEDETTDDVPNRWPVSVHRDSTGDGYQNVYTQKDVVQKQNAFLPAPPSELSQVDDVNSLSTEEKFEMSQLPDRYTSGIFGGNALYLTEESWFMISPPCTSFGESAIEDRFECRLFEDTDGLTDDLYINGAEGDEQPDGPVAEELSGKNYTMTFWVKQRSEDIGDTQISDLDKIEHPIRQLFSISYPESNITTDITDNPNTRHTLGLGPITYDGSDTYKPDSSQDTNRLGMVENPNIVSETDSGYIAKTPGYELNSWQHVAISYNSNNGDMQIYINGERKEKLFGSQDISSNAQSNEVKLGKIYEDSVISIGAAYQEPTYVANERSDNRKVPQISGSFGDIIIDDMRIYNDYMPPENNIVPVNNDKLNKIYAQKTEGKYTGEITSNSITRDIKGNQISESMNINSHFNIDIDEEQKRDVNVGIIPCDGGVCIEEAMAKGNVNGWSTSFDTDEITDDDGFTELDRIKLRVELFSDNIEDTPTVSNITVDVTTNYNTCQGIQDDHQGISGNDNIVQQIQHEGEVSDVVCDMDTDGGGWTRFSYATESTGFSYYFNRYETNPLMPGKPLADCINPSCFTTAEFGMPPSMSISDFEESHINSEDDLKPQILIKSYSSSTAYELDAESNWATYTLDEELYNSQLIGNITDALNGQYSLSDYTIPVTDGCIYPTNHGYNYDMDCIDTLSIQSDNGADNHGELALSSFDSSTGTENHHIKFEQSTTDGISDIECLNDSGAYACEIYYRVGSVGEIP